MGGAESHYHDIRSKNIKDFNTVGIGFIAGHDIEKIDMYCPTDKIILSVTDETDLNKVFGNIDPNTLKCKDQKCC